MACGEAGKHGEHALNHVGRAVGYEVVSVTTHHLWMEAKIVMGILWNRATATIMLAQQQSLQVSVTSNILSYPIGLILFLTIIEDKSNIAFS